MFGNTLKGILILIMGTIIGMVVMLFMLNTNDSNGGNFVGNSIDFETIGRIPVITATINDKTVNLIVDSGASISVLNEPDMDFYGFREGTRGIETTVHGYGGIVESMKLATNARLMVGGKRLHANFRMNDINHIVNNMEDRTKYDIVGILGSDVCAQYGFIIDYNHKKIYLSKYNDIKVVAKNDK